MKTPISFARCTYSFDKNANKPKISYDFNQIFSDDIELDSTNIKTQEQALEEFTKLANAITKSYDVEDVFIRITNEINDKEKRLVVFDAYIVEDYPEYEIIYR
jgi:ribosomal protein L23